MNNFYVYYWKRMDIDSIFYVGKGKNNRYKDMSSRNKWFLNIVNKVGLDNIKIEVIESNLSEQDAFKKEIFYIEKFKSEGHQLVNLTSGGDGSSDWYSYLSEEEKEKHKEKSKSFLGKKHTKETKMKMSEKAKGRKWNDEYKKLFSEKAKGREGFWKGKKLSMETRKKISESKMGKKHSEETKKKIANSQIGRKGTTNKIVYIIIKGEIKYVYESKKDCIREKPEGLTAYFIEKNLKLNKNLQEKPTGDLIVIYKEDYDRLKAQSTIENTSIGEKP